MDNAFSVVENAIVEYETCTPDVIATEVLEALSDAGFAIVYAPRKNELRQRAFANFLQGEWR